jgi:hypothetical protein
VSNLPNCKSGTEGADADSGVVGGCQSFSSGTDIGSVEFVCYGTGISSVPDAGSAAKTSTVVVVQPTAGSSGSTGGSSSGSTTSNNDDDDGCCSGDECCCVVM